jgi:hypothetical protein
VANFAPSIDPPRGFNARERHRLAPRRREPCGNFPALSTGYKTAANIVPSDKAEALPHPRQIPDRIEQNARGLHPLESWRVLVSYATRIRAEVALVSDAAGSRT